jgi:sugar phosphate isomerase/epimerase
VAQFKKAICNDAFQNWEIDDVFRYISHLGYDGVELNPYILGAVLEEISSDGRERIRKSAEYLNIEIIGIHSILKGPKGFFYINHPEASVRAATVEHLKALINLCGDLGGWIIPMGASKQRNVMPELTYQQAWDYAAEVFVEVLETAERRGVILCLEPLSHNLTNFITRASEAVKMVQEIDHPNFKMMLDVRSASHDEMPIPDLIRNSAQYLAHFHANDDNGGGPGTGNADYDGISKALKEVGYEGYLSVEVFNFQPDPETIASESLKTLRKYFD